MLRLFDLLFPPRTDERTIRDCSIDELLSLVAPQIVDYTRPGTVTLLPFHHATVRAALHEAKYHGNAHAFTLLGAALAEYLQDNDDLPKKTVVIPVPLGKARLKERGFNQVHEALKRARLGLPIEADFLERVRETGTQVGLARERREQNMRGAFIVSPKLLERRRINPTYLYIVVDDVITTGATLQAAVDALTAAGALHILPIALAH
jgi:predicted amidophosphoribosyltransferase